MPFRSAQAFRVRWWAVASIAPVVAVAFVFLFPEPIATSFGFAVLSALIAVVVYLISGRRDLAANLAFAILMVTLAAGVGVLSWWTSSLHAQALMLDSEMRLSRAMKLATDAQDDFVSAGSVSAMKLDQPDEIDRRKTLLDTVRARMFQALRTGDSAAADLDRQMRSERVLIWHRRRAIDQLDGDTKWSYYSGTVRVTLPFYAACAEFLDYLKAHRSEWSVTPNSNNIEFHSAAVKAKADALRDAMRNAAADVQGAPLRVRAAATRSTL